MKAAVHQHVNCRTNAQEASKVLGRTFVLLDRDGSLFWTTGDALPRLSYKRVVAQYKLGKARHVYA